MGNEPVNVACPNCDVPCAARTPPDRQLAWWDTFGGETEVQCPCCGWEFRIDTDGSVSDTGEVEPEAELVIDADGDLTEVAAEDDELPPWHALASTVREAGRWRGWRDHAEPVEEECEREGEPALVARPAAANCPDCRRGFPNAWPGDLRCPDCGLRFRVDRDPPDGDPDDETGPADPLDAGRPLDPGATPPRPLVVCRAGDGDATSIGQALRRAGPGQRILIRPGLYEEHLGVTSGVELVGDGPREEVVVAARGGACLAVESDRARVRGLTFRGLARAGDRPFPAVDLRAGLLEDCAVTSNSLAGVRLERGALRGCRVHDCEQAGVLAAGGLVEDCDILHNAGPGLLVQTGSLLVRRCRIRDGHAEGVRIGHEASATMVECDVRGNARAGVTVHGERTLLWKCALHDGLAEGLRVADEGVAFVERCTVRGNARVGIRATGGGLYVWRCVVGDNRNGGIRVGPGGVAELFGSAIHGNGRFGVRAHRGARPVLRRCRLRGNRR